MDQYQNERLELQLLETTSIFNKEINCNCFFDGYNLMYLGAAHIIFHNVFQNNKLFLERYTTSEAEAMAFHKSSADLSIAIVARNPLCFVEFYVDAKKLCKIQLYEQLQIIDMKFIQKKKCCLLAYDRAKKITSLYIVSLQKNIHKIQLSETHCHKLICSEGKLLILLGKGYLQFEMESERVGKEKKYGNISIVDILVLDHDKGVIFDDQNNYYYFSQKQIIYQGNLSQNLQRNVQYKSSIKIGKNILISIKQEFTITQYQFDEHQITFINHFQYVERIKGNIIDMHSFGDQLNLAIAFQTHYKQQNRVEHYLFNLSILSNQRKFINPFTRLVQGGIEHGEVVALQLTIPSQVYYMSGPYVINYSYVQNIQKKHKYSIHQNPRFIAVHPLGHQIVCIFQTTIKFYQKVQSQQIQIWSQGFICNNARYTDSGLLVLCVYQQGIYQIVLYDSNYFRTIHKFNGIYLKHAITRIDFDEDESELILYSNKDLLIHRFKTGEKLSQFRQKREIPEATCIQYDSIRKCLLVASKNKLIICRKTQQYCLNFNSHKTVQIGHEIVSIHLNEYSQSIFMGTADGQILYTQYPLVVTEQTMSDEKIFKTSFKSIKVHNHGISNILATLGGKYIFCSIRGEGLCILKIKYLTSRNTGNFNHFDISNYNFIQPSSKSCLQFMQEKLKGLLQKRKTIFNELDQFKKEWELKRLSEINTINTKNKRRELQEINFTLSEINRTKLQHQAILEELSKFQKTVELSKIQNQKNHETQLLKFYDQNDVLKSKLDEVSVKCSREIMELKQQCCENLKQISSQLQEKFRSFQENYNIMKENLINFKKRTQFEEQQNIITQQLQIQYTKESLIKEEQDLYRCNHEVKGEIARNKKQLQRFLNRRDFLQNKRRFFVEQIKLCRVEQNELKEVKGELEQELSNLESITHKKQKRLRKYFMQNDILVKYQFIHDKLQKQTNKEIEFIEQQHKKLKENIGELQKEILFISSERDKHQVWLRQKREGLGVTKERVSKINQKGQFLQFQIRQLDHEIFKIDNNKQINQQSKNQYYTEIYQRFFINKQLEMLISNNEIKQNQLILEENKQNQKAIHNILNDHKEYLINNMDLLEQYKSRANQEINHSYLKYQNQNYNLISQCNDKKQQIINKKRILHQLVYEMQKTNKYISQIHSSSRIKEKKVESTPKKDIPFIVYEKKLEEEKAIGKKEKSQSCLWKLKQSSYQVRKMLEIQKLKSPEEKEPIRRIQTANLKKKTKEQSHQCQFQNFNQNCDQFVYEEKKPRTAGTAVRRYQKKQNLEAKRIFSRNKFSSKPTTCSISLTNNGTKSKYSIFY